MSREVTDTTNKYNNSDPLPEGKRRFIVAGPVVKKYGKNGAEFYIWKLQYETGIGEQVLLPNMMGGLLRVLDCMETEPNKFDWMTEDQEGKAFIAEVKFVQDKKDPSKTRQQMAHFEKVKDEESVSF